MVLKQCKAKNLVPKIALYMRAARCVSCFYASDYNLARYAFHCHIKVVSSIQGTAKVPGCALWQLLWRDTPSCISRWYTLLIATVYISYTHLQYIHIISYHIHILHSLIPHISLHKHYDEPQILAGWVVDRVRWHCPPYRASAGSGHCCSALSLKAPRHSYYPLPVSATRLSPLCR